MGFVASTEKTAGTRIGAKEGRRTRRPTVTMRTLVPKDPHPDVDALRQRIWRRSEGDCAKSGAQDDGLVRADEIAATVTGTSGQYATPIEMLGQPSLDGRREPVLWNRMMPLLKIEDERA